MSANGPDYLGLENPARFLYTRDTTGSSEFALRNCAQKFTLPGRIEQSGERAPPTRHARRKPRVAVSATCSMNLRP